MNKILFIACFCLLVMVSCENKYSYIEIVKDKGVQSGKYTDIEKEPETIKAENDSLAYIQAFRKFCVAVYVNEVRYKASNTRYIIPIDFKLLNSNKEDVKEKYFGNRKDIEEAIFDMIPLTELDGQKLTIDEFKDAVYNRLY